MRLYTYRLLLSRLPTLIILKICKLLWHNILRILIFRHNSLVPWSNIFLNIHYSIKCFIRRKGVACYRLLVITSDWGRVAWWHILATKHLTWGYLDLFFINLRSVFSICCISQLLLFFYRWLPQIQSIKFWKRCSWSLFMNFHYKSFKF